jgi:hypothetical protein
MEKLLANFLKGMGITPELIQEKMQTLVETVQVYDKRLAQIELQNTRIERMMILLCAKTGVVITDIYPPAMVVNDQTEKDDTDGEN